MAQHTSDDAFHEIQLNGKQLVFLFMVATVVSVVIFLCGVLVGRGVQAEGSGTVADGALSSAPDMLAQPPFSPPTASSDPTAAASPPTVDDLSYFNRLENTTPAIEELKPAVEKTPAPVPAAKVVEERATPPPAKPAVAANRAAPPEDVSAKEEPASAVAPAAAVPTGPGYAVQIAALKGRSEADAIARRLSSKGYAAYVISPANGTPQVYRVRVGKFGTRREADVIATKLQKEEQFKPWVTR